MKYTVKIIAPCSNADVQFYIDGVGILSCVPKGKGEYVVDIPKGQNTCIQYIITCPQSECSDCPPIVGEVCPCKKDKDCKNCSTCNEKNGQCETKCTKDQFCDNDECVECSDEFPCSGGRICVNGHCTCPPSKPYWDDKKEVCVPCNEEHPCPKCNKCTPDGCVPIVCPEGVCLDDKCVECVYTTDCKKPNEKCNNNTCVCIDGFVRNVVTGECEPIPECTKDIDCKNPCDVCGDKGKCMPIVCPEGYICVGDKKCVKECDCSKPTCDDGSPCVTHSSGKCYCSKCTDANGNCINGCVRIDGICVPDPCKNKTCDNANDCGLDCGCTKDKTCKLCATLSLSDCETTLGCKKQGEKCVPNNPCPSIACTSSDECGEECVCNGGLCDPCSKYSCEDCSLIKDCACTSGKCAKKQEDCLDKLEVTKIDSTCDINVKYDLKTTCACSQITLDTFVTAVAENETGYVVTFVMEARKGSASNISLVNTLPLLGNTANINIADNDLPTSGLVTIKILPKYKEVRKTDGLVLNRFDGTAVSTSYSFVNSDTQYAAGLELPKPNTLVSENQLSKVLVAGAVVTIEQTSDFTFVNGCKYKSTNLIKRFQYSETNGFEEALDGSQSGLFQYSGYVTLQSFESRLPMLRIYRSDDNTYTQADIYRKLYLPKSGLYYTDNLLGLAQINPKGKFPLVGEEGEIWNNRNYKFEFDCGCDRTKEINNLTFCNPTQLYYTTLNCNKTLRLQEPFLPCTNNQDIRKWETNGYDIPNDTQTIYELYVNGSLFKTFQHDKDYGMVVSGTTTTMFQDYDFNVPVTSLRLHIKHDNTSQCDLVYNLPAPAEVDYFYTATCNDNNTITFNIPINQAGSSISSVSGTYLVTGNTVNITATNNGTNWVVTVPKGSTPIVKVVFANGCESTKTLTKDCCSDFIPTIVNNDISCGGTLELGVNTNGGQSPFTYNWSFPDGSTSTEESPTVENASGGLYQVEVLDANGCKKKATKTITVLDQPTATMSQNVTACLNQIVNITVQANVPTSAGGQLTYSINGVDNTVTVPIDGIYNILVPSGSVGTFVVVLKEITTVSGCTKVFNTVRVVNVLDEVIGYFTNTTMPVICNGSSATLTIEGSPLATLNIQNYGNYQIPISGTGSISVSPSTNTTYTITSIQLGGCAGDVTGLTPITVTVVPGQGIMVVSDTCSGDDRTIEFDFIDSAVDNNNNSLTVTSNTVTVDSNLTTSVTAYYDNGTCISSYTYQVTKCVCDIQYTQDLIVLPSDLNNIYNFNNVQVTVRNTANAITHQNSFSVNSITSNGLANNIRLWLQTVIGGTVTYYGQGTGCCRYYLKMVGMPFAIGSIEFNYDGVYGAQSPVCCEGNQLGGTTAVACTPVVNELCDWVVSGYAGHGTSPTIPSDIQLTTSAGTYLGGNGMTNTQLATSIESWLTTNGIVFTNNVVVEYQGKYIVKVVIEGTDIIIYGLQTLSNPLGGVPIGAATHPKNYCENQCTYKINSSDLPSPGSFSTGLQFNFIDSNGDLRADWTGGFSVSPTYINYPNFIPATLQPALVSYLNGIGCIGATVVVTTTTVEITSSCVFGHVEVFKNNGNGNVFTDIIPTTKTNCI